MNIEKKSKKITIDLSMLLQWSSRWLKIVQQCFLPDTKIGLWPNLSPMTVSKVEKGFSVRLILKWMKNVLYMKLFLSCFFRREFSRHRRVISREDYPLVKNISMKWWELGTKKMKRERIYFKDSQISWVDKNYLIKTLTILRSHGKVSVQLNLIWS